MSAAPPRPPVDPVAQAVQAIRTGYAMIANGRAADALEVSRRLLDAFPASVQVLVFAAEASLANGDPHAALAHLDAALQASNGDSALKIKKAELLQQMRQRRAAIALVAEAAAELPGDGRASWRAGAITNSCNDPRAAIAHYERARSLLGDPPPLLYDLAVAQFFSGEFDDAERNLDRMLAADPQAGHALYLRSTLRRQTPDRNHVADLEQRLAAGFERPAAEAAARYALAQELEDLGEHERSFAELSKAASTLRATFQYDLASELQAMDDICRAYTPEVMADAADGDEGADAIFIVGMPRTGTTLAERMLARTGHVAAAGELLDFGNLLGLMTGRVDPAAGANPAERSLHVDFASLGREYLRGARDTAGPCRMFIDKMPINFLYLGAIRKALPKARIVHLSRDPLDTCYAVYKTLFFSAYKFSYDQSELADYYAGYRRMMRHWHEVMPGQILDIRYEDLVRNPEAESRRLLEWCGLEWHPGVLEAGGADAAVATASAAQVREPVHSRSIHSSRRHLDGLAPLRERLALAGLDPVGAN
jgi:tetratricopeptide (TPR) repeat protein